MPPESSNSQGIERILTDIALAIRSQATRTVDANGWTVLQFGSHTRYVKRVTATLSSFNGPAFAPALATPLPVGVVNHNATIGFHATFVHNNSGAVRFVAESQGTDTNIQVVGTTSATYNGTVLATYEMIV